jgi:hypothetical protein
VLVAAPDDAEAVQQALAGIGGLSPFIIH